MKITTRFTSLDGLRGIFCIGLVIYHTNDVFHSASNTLLWPVYHYGGYFGNYIFFMMSGLLISYRYKEQICGQTISFYQYMYKRIMKLCPLYLLSNLAMVLYLLFKNKSVDFDSERLFSSFFMFSSGWFTQSTPYNHPTWFVCVLTLCYILYYIIGKISHHFSKLYLPLCFFLIFWGMFLEIKAWDIPFSFRICGEGYMNFFIGVFFAETLLSTQKSSKSILIFNGLCLGFLIALVLRNKFEPPFFCVRWFITFICFNLIYIAVHEKYAIKLLSHHMIQKIGKCSFSIYIWHIPVIWWLLYLESCVGLTSINGQINLILFLLLLLFVAQISYRFFEK